MFFLRETHSPLITNLIFELDFLQVWRKKTKSPIRIKANPKTAGINYHNQKYHFDSSAIQRILENEYEFGVCARVARFKPKILICLNFGGP
jgi:hypothetical protein